MSNKRSFENFLNKLEDIKEHLSDQVYKDVIESVSEIMDIKDKKYYSLKFVRAYPIRKANALFILNVGGDEAILFLNDEQYHEFKKCENQKLHLDKFRGYIVGDSSEAHGGFGRADVLESDNSDDTVNVNFFVEVVHVTSLTPLN